jgi:hypothetical protein
MTMGTAIVASTKVRRIGPMVVSQGARARFSPVRVGKTASQIIMASSCLVGGRVTAGRVAGVGVMVVPFRTRWRWWR